MPISSIIEQPAADDLKASYRPIVLKVRATRTDAAAQPPVVYCDIYVNGVYYKSQEKTQLIALNATNSDWQFDIQDACQEVLRSIIAENGGSTIVTASASFATIYCKFRSSGFDADGFVTPEDTAPIQGTGSNSPVAGTGTQSNTFYVVNAVLQHENNQDLATHLDSFKNGTWDPAAHPLTHRTDSYQVCENNSDYFPIVYTGSAALSCIKLNYILRDGTTGGANNCEAYPTCPIVTGIDIDSVDNGNGTQTFTFTWGTPSPLLSGIIIQYRIDGSSDPFTDASGSASSGRILTLPLGLYEFQFQMTGSCSTTTSDPFPGEGIESPECVPVEIAGSPSMEDAVSGSAYSYSFSVTGTPPFNITGVTKPSWLNIDVSGSDINFSGTPSSGDEGTLIPVSFTVENDCGTEDFADTINVNEPSAPDNYQFVFIANPVVSPGDYWTVGGSACSALDAGFSASGPVYLNPAALDSSGNIISGSGVFTNAAATIPFDDTTQPNFVGFRIMYNLTTGIYQAVDYQTTSGAAAIFPEAC